MGNGRQLRNVDFDKHPLPRDFRGKQEFESKFCKTERGQIAALERAGI